MLRFIYVAFVPVLLLFGCTTPYFGYSEVEWNALSSKEKRAAKEDYQQVLDQRDKDHHDEQIDEFQGKIIEQGLGVAKPLRRY